MNQISKACITGLCGKNPPVTLPVDSPNKGPVMWRSFPWHDVIMNGAILPLGDLILKKKWVVVSWFHSIGLWPGCLQHHSDIHLRTKASHGCRVGARLRGNGNWLQEKPVEGRSKVYAYTLKIHMIKSSYGNIFRVTDPLSGDRLIPHTKASDAELWCFLWSAAE